MQIVSHILSKYKGMRIGVEKRELMECAGLPEELKCPVCLQYYTGQIFQCVSGHSICSNCLKRVTLCPQCRVAFAYGKIQNRSLEALIDSLTVPCLYKINGCSKKVQYTSLKDHSRYCSFGNIIPLCKDMGFVNCSFKLNPSNILEAKDHFVREHGALKCWSNTSKACANVYFRDVEDLDGEKHCSWRPVLFEVDQNEDMNGDTFVVICKFNAVDKTLSWKCFHLGDDLKQAAKYFVDLEIESENEQVGRLKWRMGAISILRDRAIIESSIFKLDHSLLQQHFIVGAEQFSEYDDDQNDFSCRKFCDDGLFLKISICAVDAINKIGEENDKVKGDILWAAIESTTWKTKPCCLINEGRGLSQPEIAVIKKLSELNSISIFKLLIITICNSFKLIIEIMLTLLVIGLSLCLWQKETNTTNNYIPIRCFCNNIHEILIRSSNWMVFLIENAADPFLLFKIFGENNTIFNCNDSESQAISVLNY